MCNRVLGFQFLLFLKKNLEDFSSFCGAADTPVLDFWWRLPWVSKPEWIPRLHASSPVCNGFFLAVRMPLGTNNLLKNFHPAPFAVDTKDFTESSNPDEPLQQKTCKIWLEIYIYYIIIF